jgi:hypothetical protein
MPVPSIVHWRLAGHPHWGRVSLHGLSEHGVPVLDDVSVVLMPVEVVCMDPVLDVPIVDVELFEEEPVTPVATPPDPPEPSPMVVPVAHAEAAARSAIAAATSVPALVVDAGTGGSLETRLALTSKA